MVTKRFRFAEKNRWVKDKPQPFKSLFRVDKFQRPGIHRPVGDKSETDLAFYNGSGLPQTEFTTRNFQCTDPQMRALAQVNHYIVKDAASFTLKNAKGSAHQANRAVDQDYWKKRNKNQEIDNSMEPYELGLSIMMEELNDRTGGALRKLTAEALAIHRARFREVIKSPESRALFEYCLTYPRVPEHLRKHCPVLVRSIAT